MRAVIISLAAFMATGCVAISATERTALIACSIASKGERMIETRLYLGMESPKGPVTEEAFRAFIDAEVTPRWKEGFTLLTGEGHWLSEERHIAVREPSRILVRLNDGSGEASAGVEAIRAAYIKQFTQDAVLRTDAPVCASF